MRNGKDNFFTNHVCVPMTVKYLFKSKQGDQIFRVFANRAIYYFGQFFEMLTGFFLAL
jgi:hypothetical protein